MTNYANADYWNTRYEAEEDHPFDWLCDYFDVANIIENILPDKNSKILIVGCGNAPFSSDLYAYGNYNKIINIDLSSVVIQQQTQKHPEQIWKVMNALNTTFPDNTFPVIIDKSLIDTLLCCTDSKNKVRCLMDEMFRILSPGGRFITFSLHSIDEVNHFYQVNHHDNHWQVKSYHLKSNRRNDTDLRKRAVAYTMIICDKAFEDGTFSALHKELTNLNAEQILQSEEYLKLKHEAERKNLEYAIHHASYDVLKYIFFHTLIKDKNKSKMNFSIKYIENFDFQKVLHQEKKNFIKELKKITDDNNIPQHKHDPDDDGVMTTLCSSHVNYIDNSRHQINNDYRNQMYELVQ